MDTQTKKEVSQFLRDILENVDDTNIANTKKAMRENAQRTADKTE